MPMDTSLILGDNAIINAASYAGAIFDGHARRRRCR